MESKQIAESPQTTLDLAVQSFEVSSGSMGAQSLFIKGLALHENVSFEEMLEKLKDSILNTNESEFKGVLERMAYSHRNNDPAKKTSGVFLKNRPMGIDIKEKFVETFPRPKHLHQVYLYQEGKYDKIVIDKTLEHVWSDPDTTRRNNNIKLISSTLGCFNEFTEWWKKMGEDKQKEMIEKGAEILNRQQN